MAIQTGGFQVGVLPSINFADGAQLAGHGPGEAIAGFNSGIGLVDALANVGNKAVLMPIQQDEARARLAQIQAETQLQLAQAPYRNALARIELAKSSLPIKDQNNIQIVRVPRLDANGQPTGQFDLMKRASGNEIDPLTMQRTPFSENIGIQTTAEADALQNSLIQHRQALNDAAVINAQTKGQLADIAGQNAGLKANLTRAQADLANERVNRLKVLEKQGKVQLIQSVDANGNLVVTPIDLTTRQAGQSINLNTKPNRAVDPLAAVILGAFQKPTTKTQAMPPPEGGSASIYDRVKGFFSPTPSTQPVSAPPDIPITPSPVTVPSAQIAPTDQPLTNEEIDGFFNPDAVQTTDTPVPATQKSPYTIRVVKP